MSQKKIENLNYFTHLLGALIGLFFFIYTLVHRENYGNFIFAGLLIYNGAFIFLFLSSAIYHKSLAENSKLQKYLRVLDHSAIYVFIAGTYTPILIFLFDGTARIVFLSVIWAIALAGIIYKLVSRGNYDKYKKLSTLLYIIMGWISVMFIRRIYEVFGIGWILFFILGGIAYSGGTYFYKSGKSIYNHVIWHLFVLLGAFLQLIPIFSVIMKPA